MLVLTAATTPLAAGSACTISMPVAWKHPAQLQA
jgi:hypothetical protein